MAIYLGIDFGTSTNYIVQWDLKKRNIQSEYFEEGDILDNVIYYTCQGAFIGREAIDKASIGNPLNLVKNIKREIDKDNWTTYIPALKRDLTSKDIVTDIFREIKKKVEKKHNDESIGGAVIGVPFAFLYKEKQKIRKSALEAGIKVLDIIEEPVAAAIRYLDFNENFITEEKKDIVIFDLGGGTLDITICRIYKNNDEIFLDILNTDGDKYLGGKDITDFILNYLLKSVNIELSDINNSESKENIIKSLINDSEKAKKEISTWRETNVFNDIDGLDIDIDISEKDLYKILKINGFIDEIESKIYETLDDISLDLEKIEEVILVGGSSKLNIVKDIIREIFKCKIVEFENPDKLVGEGCALYCGNILNIKNKYNINSILSQGIGICKNGKFHPMIEKGSRYGTKSNTEKIKVNNRDKIIIDVYQGISSDIKKCSHIGDISIDVSNLNTEVICFELSLEIDQIIRYSVFIEDDTLNKNIIYRGELL